MEQTKLGGGRTRARKKHIFQAAFEQLENRTLFSVWTVTNLNDDGSAGSLRSVIASASAASGDQTVEFETSLTAGGPETLTLDGLALELDHTSSGSLTIQGPTNNPLTITQSNNNFYEIGDFDFGVDSGSTAVINDLTITGGYKSFTRGSDDLGGGIESSGTLTLNNCLVTDNTASVGGGIYQSGPALLTVNNSTISGNFGTVGGGIYASNLVLNQSTLSNNYAGSGGGICGTENITVTQSTISGNVAEQGGGIIDNNGTTLDVSASTIAGNVGDGGSGIDCAGDSTINDSTIAGNSSPDSGVGIYGFDATEGEVTIDGSIISGNGTDLSGYFSLTDSLVGDQLYSDTAIIDSSTPSGENDYWGEEADLAPLGYYGGPTETMPPLSGSAIGTYLPYEGITRAPTDQRGFPMGTDLGAFQTDYESVGAFQTLDVTTTSDDPTGAGELSLRDAVNLANAAGGNQTITFDPSLSTTGQATLNLTGGAIEMDDSTGTLTIDGADSANAVTVNAASGSGAFAVNTGSSAEITGLSIGGLVSDSGTLIAVGDTSSTTTDFSVEVIDGGMLNLPSSITIASLTIDAGGKVAQTSTDTTFGSEALTVGSLTIDGPSGTTNGGVLDLGNGDLILRSTSASSIVPLLAAGYDGGMWDGAAVSGPNPAAIVSSAAAQDPYQIETLGSAQIGTDTSDGDLNLSTFDGLSVSSGDTVVALTYYGDANLDREVNSTDSAMMNSDSGGSYEYGSGTAADLWTDGDFNYDGVFDAVDAFLLNNAVTTLGAVGAGTPHFTIPDATVQINSKTGAGQTTLHLTVFNGADATANGGVTTSSITDNTGTVNYLATSVTPITTTATATGFDVTINVTGLQKGQYLVYLNAGNAGVKGFVLNVN